jgi:predicted glycogen debranching enzyme
MSFSLDDRTEWLEADGLGGFASGTTSGIRSRRYHALLLAAATPPTGRFVLVNGLDVRAGTDKGEFILQPQHYAPGVTDRSAEVVVERFTNDPWPRWVFRLPDGTSIAHEVFAVKGSARTVVTWRLLEGRGHVKIRVRPLMSGRDYHSLHHENQGFRFEPEESPGRVRWSPYPGVPATTIHHNGRYVHSPAWYRNFQYDLERERGLDSSEDLASPGIFELEINGAEALLVLEAQTGEMGMPTGGDMAEVVASLRASEGSRRLKFVSPLERAADSYLVKRGEGSTIVAGYPWFTDWGRDTFIALRGLCLATGRLDEARSILREWAGAVSGGMLPNRFTDDGGGAEYNSVDASLWFVIAAHDLEAEARRRGKPLAADEATMLHSAVESIISGYARGTRFGIRMDEDGLLRAGASGVQLTWMDAKLGDWVVTPRVGKPVEIQALWLNALKIASRTNPDWKTVLRLGQASFKAKFWNQSKGCLFDVIDVDHQAGHVDDSVRPNQILAVGGLPVSLLPDDQAQMVVDRVEKDLLTPVGLRSLSPGSPGYRPRYGGDPHSRDSAYHQGTVWPWLLGPFVEAWVRVRGDSNQARAEARKRFFDPMQAHLGSAGLGHVSEVADAESPHTPGGCPFQAWSVAELLRLDKQVLAPIAPTTKDSDSRRAAARRTDSRGGSGPVAVVRSPTLSSRRAAV